jgi:hypothetical protein
VVPSWRDHQAEEHARYEFLVRLYQDTRPHPQRVVHAGAIGYQVGLTRVQTFAIAEFLADRGYIEYLGAGPRIRIAPRGIRYIEWEASDRRSIR